MRKAGIQEERALGGVRHRFPYWTEEHKYEALSPAERGGDSKSPCHRDDRGTDEDLQLFAGQLARTREPVPLRLGLQHGRCYHALLVRDHQEGQRLYRPQRILDRCRYRRHDSSSWLCTLLTGKGDTYHLYVKILV